MTSYKIAYGEGYGEIIEKKSRFLAGVFPIKTEEEAQNYLEKVRKQYWDASHHCFAYVLGETNEIQRASDDGEPSGTAGKPILDVLLGEEIHNGLIIVTRYFGGTLLGTGGLVRSYAKAAKEGLCHAQIVEKCPGKEYLITMDYHEIGKIQYIIGEINGIFMETEYTDKVTILVLIASGTAGTFEKKVEQATSGRVCAEMVRELYYGKGKEKDIIIFDR